MKTYSLLIAWDDDDPDVGDFGATVRAADEDEAENLVRAQMRASYAMDYGSEGEEYAHEDGAFGGRVIDLCEGAIWKAKELEEALRAVIATEMAPGDNAKRHAAFEGARKLIAEIEAGRLAPPHFHAEQPWQAVSFGGEAMPGLAPG